MPGYLYWGDDSFALNRAVQVLRDRTLDPAWASFNYTKFGPDQADGIIQALNDAMTPPFGMGQRLVWVAESTVGQRCAENEFAELQRTLPIIPDTCVLLFTATSKPDGRLKSTKFLQKHLTVKEFSAIPPWKTDLLIRNVQAAAKEVGVALSQGAAEQLAEAVGNDTRQLYSELEKLSLYASASFTHSENTDHKGPSTSPGSAAVLPTIDEAAIALLVSTYTQNSLKLADAIRQGNTDHALSLVTDLFNRNEPALRIVATLVGRFRMWLWVKLMVETGERDDKAIARAADVGNPKRIYFLKQEVRSMRLSACQQSMVHLLELEAGLKSGANDRILMSTKVIELCQLFRR
ncbi:MAG: DNA polymerase III subunit delta [Symploca sp. SIO2B6]|nr:DNA polymerase III subunit delta [Symploca sp. SIO2B6]